MTTRVMIAEDEVVRRAVCGEAGAFDCLVERFGPRVYNLALRLLGNADDAQDLAQEAFLRVYDALPRFRGDAAFTTWLYRIVVNACHDELARRKRRPLVMSDLEAEDGDGPTFADTLAAGATTEDMLRQREQQRVLQQAIAELPEPFRTALVLYDMQGCSYQEIVVITRANLGTVKSRINRARNLLREKIAPQRELFGLEDRPST